MVDRSGMPCRNTSMAVLRIVLRMSRSMAISSVGGLSSKEGP